MASTTTKRTKRDTITFQPTAPVASVLARVQREDGVEFASRVINNALTRHFASRMTDKERNHPKAAPILRA